MRQEPAVSVRTPRGQDPCNGHRSVAQSARVVLNLTTRIDELEHKLDVYRRPDERCDRRLRVPGVGLLTSTAVVAAVGDAKEFRSGREFAAWLGLVPRQSGTGGKVRLLGISKRGNAYLRALLIHCARAIACPEQSLQQYSRRARRRCLTWIGPRTSRRLRARYGHPLWIRSIAKPATKHNDPSIPAPRDVPLDECDRHLWLPVMPDSACRLLAAPDAGEGNALSAFV